MLLTRLFGGNVEGMGQRERTMRAQLVSQVFSSAAIGLLNCYEKGEHAPGEKLRLGDLLLGGYGGRGTGAQMVQRGGGASGTFGNDLARCVGLI